MNIDNHAKGIKKIESRTMFAPLFRSRWQNMQNIVNDSAFMASIPEPYLSYYMAYIRQWQQWASGFVPQLHRGDFFSTGMGYTVCDIFARECMSGGYRLDSTDCNLKQFLESYGEDEGLSDTLNEMFFYANAGGNAMLCLTLVNGELYPSAIPINRIFFQIGRRGKITQATILNRFVSGQSAYYTREHRTVLDDKSYYCVTLASGTLVTSPEWKSSSLKKVPKDIESQWHLCYGGIEPSVWYEMPRCIQSLGMYNVKNKACAVALSGMPGYSDSTLHTALDVLYSIDYNYTQGQVDQYIGKARALIPKEMQAAQVRTVVNGESFENAINRPQLEDEFYVDVKTQGVNGEQIKPTFMQADLRGEARKYIRDADLELLASKVGLSSSTLANHLSYNTSKTATEVRSEQDTTEKSVNIKRGLANRAINAMLNDIAKFYGFKRNAEITWGRAGANSSVENQELLADYQAGTLSLRQYLKRRWSDLSEAEIDVMIQEISQEKKQSAFGGLALDDSEYFGG